MKRFALPKFLSEMDFSLLGSTLLLLTIGVMAIASSGVDAEGNRFSNEYIKQLIWAGTGILLGFLVMAVHAVISEKILQLLLLGGDILPRGESSCAKNGQPGGVKIG